MTADAGAPDRAASNGAPNGQGRVDWRRANQAYLTAALAVVRAKVEERAAPAESKASAAERRSAARRVEEDAAKGMPAAPALDALCRVLGLSPFERDVLLLCAGVELETGFSRCWLEAHPEPRSGAPTFALALAMLPEAHYSAILPSAPLRHFRIIEVGAGEGLMASPLRIDERVLHFLAGFQYLEERLANIVEPLRAEARSLPPSHRILADRIGRIWSQRPEERPPVVQLVGVEGTGRRLIAATACAEIGSTPYVLAAHTLGGASVDEHAVARLLSREAALGGMALVLDCDDLDANDTSRRAAAARLVDRVAGPVLVTSRVRLRLGARSVVTLDVKKPPSVEQRILWKEAIGAAAETMPTFGATVNPSLEEAVDALVAQFDLGAASIESACIAAVASASEPAGAAPEPARALWNACRSEARPHLDNLAQRIEPVASWDDLVLPEPQRESLREIAIHVRQRSRVYESWGFASKGERGLGIATLFAGASGTGKTMAAEVLARDLGLDLYRVDLSQVVSKYIGETEKNLRRIFDAAEEGAAILLFDEADALFGKRSEVKDSHDRFANIEVSYLLQKMEAFRGLAVLTTNMKSALDVAFLRRLRFVVQFPFPGMPQRAAIWRRVFPASTPTEGLDVEQLAKMNVAGGNIRNIALNAAFLAAEEGEPVRMKHVQRAARSEYAKLERALTAAEMGG